MINNQQAMTLANQHLNEGKLKEAATLLQKILKANPEHAEALHLMGITLYHANQKEQGIELVLKAIKIHQDPHVMCSNLTEMYRQMGEIKKAVEQAYKVNVENVRTMIAPAKSIVRNTKSGVLKGRKPSVKKAVIEVRAGETIDIYANL